MFILLALVWGTSFLWIKIPLVEIEPFFIGFPTVAVRLDRLTGHYSGDTHPVSTGLAAYRKILLAQHLCDGSPVYVGLLGRNTH